MHRVYHTVKMSRRLRRARRDDISSLRVDMGNPGLIDRTNCWSQGHRAILRGDKQISGPRIQGLRNKVGGIIVVTHRAGGTQAVRQISDFFRLHRIIEAGAAIAYGQEKGEVRNDEQGMSEAWWVGKAMVNKIKLIQGIK